MILKRRLYELSIVLALMLGFPYALFAQSHITNPPEVSYGTVAHMPSAVSGKNTLYLVTDGNSATDCSVGVGSTYVLCTSNGATWSAMSGGAGSMTWPSGGAGVPYYSGSSTWGTSLTNVMQGGSCAPTGSGTLTYTDSVATPCSTFAYSLSSGTVSSGTLSGFQTGKTYNFQVTADGTHTFVWPTGTVLPPLIIPTASIVTSYSCTYDGANCNPTLGSSAAYSLGSVVAGTGDTIGSGQLALWFDNTSTKNRLKTKDSAGAYTGTFRDQVAATAKFLTSAVDGVFTNGFIYSGSAPTLNNGAKFDANGLVTDAGAACGTATMVWPSGGAGIPYYSGSSTWGTSLTKQGSTGTAVQMFAGSAPSTDDCAKFDASGNLVTAGAACGTSSMVYPGAGTAVSTGSGWAPALAAPAIGSSDTLSCSATSNITTQYVAFATTVPLPAFTQTAGASFDLIYDTLSTTSGTCSAISVELLLDSTPIYTSNSPSTMGCLNSKTNVQTKHLLRIYAPVIGASGSVYVSTPLMILTDTQPSHFFNGTGNPVTVDTTAAHTLSVALKCNASTAGNTVTAIQGQLIRIY